MYPTAFFSYWGHAEVIPVFHLRFNNREADTN